MIDVLLTTYNGEKYLQALLDSLEGQTCGDWRLIAVDDCSRDGTVAILRRFQQLSAHEVEIHVNEKGEGCGKNNFFRLLHFAQSPYIMFCDQDDVWLESKIEKSMAGMRALEEQFGGKGPLLVYTDLVVVDEALRTIDRSFYHYSSYGPDLPLSRLLCQNQVTGCTILANRQLYQLCARAREYDRICMHDSWFALAALTFGHARFIDEGLILYRQHGDNTVGAPDTKSLRYKLGRFFNRPLIVKSNMDHVREARYFYDTYRALIDRSPQGPMIRDYAALADQPRRAYRKVCRRYGILKYPGLRAFAQILYAHR